MNLLEVRNLTIRFGGLTAVTQVSFDVEQGSICSIIGPNGAGKTTVFNAITGIYEPSEGTILFAGKALRRSVTWKVVAACAIIGLLCGVASLLIMSNVDAMWRAAIWRNNADPDEPFTYSAAWHDMLNYLQGGIDIEPRRSRSWSVVTSDGRSIKVVPTKEQATQLRDALTALAASDAAEDTGAYEVVRAEGQTVLRSDGQELATFDTAQFDTLLSDLRERHDSSLRTVWISFLAGSLLGIAGALTVWSRSRRTPDVIALGGIARTFQNIRLFPSMTVLENVLIGMDRSFLAGFLRSLLRLPAFHREEIERRKQAKEYLDFVGLAGKSRTLADSLAYGDQRRLEIARAIATAPRLLLLDEPAAGMNPTETAELTKLIRAISQRGITVLLIEHHMNVVMQISDRVIVLDRGEKIAEGVPSDVRNNPKVIEAYLGKDEEAA